MATEQSTLLNGGIVKHYTNTCDHIVNVKEYSKDDYDPIYSNSDIFYNGLTLEELLPYKDDPWWQNLRRMLFYSFWLTFLLILLTACVLSYLEGSTCNIIALNGHVDVLKNGNSNMLNQPALALVGPSYTTP